MIRGLCLGKFLPVHLGHVHMIDFARHYCDALCIVVEKMPDEPVPSEVRVDWMRELFGDCTVLHLTDMNPQTPKAHPRFWEIWRESLLRILPWAPDVLVASEDYGTPLAECLGAEFVPADIARESVPISGTQIRAQPMRHFDRLPVPVRAYYARRVRILGAESTGKSTLARRLARALNTVHVPEYAQRLIALRGGEIAEADLLRFARGQQADIEALARQANRVLICDTDALTTLLWSRLLFGRAAPELEQRAAQGRFDLTLVCAPDLPWVDDLHRVDPATRAPYHRMLVEALEAEGTDYVLLEGDGAQREARALKTIEALLAE